MDNVSNTIKKYKKQIYDLEMKLEELVFFSDKERLAIELHKVLCNANHTDGCAWFYAENDWNEYSHKKYLNMAEEILKQIDYHTAIRIIEIIDKNR